MATIRQRGNRYQVRIQRNGFPDVSKSFLTKEDAQKWARTIERQMDLGEYVPVGLEKLGDLLDRYQKEVTESDLLGEFLEDQTQADPNARIEQSALFSSYCMWPESNGTAAGSKASLTRKLKERGFVEVKSNGKRYYAGLEHRKKL